MTNFKSLLRYQNHNKPISYNSVDSDYEALTRKWVLQILVEMNGHRQLVDDDGFTYMSIVQLLGLDEYALNFNSSTKNIVLKRIMADFKGQEKNLESIPVDSQLRTNLWLLAEKIGLSSIEIKALEFWILLETTPALENALDTLGELSFTSYIQILSKLLNETEQDIKRIFSPSALLIKLAFIKPDRIAKGHFDSIVKILNSTAVDRLLDQVSSIDEVFVDIIKKVDGCNLTRNDYYHIESLFNFSVDYLGSVMNDKTSAGHNILVYGSSGTGKTEFAKLLAKTLGVELYEVSNNDGYSNTLYPRMRWQAFITAQCLLKNKKSLILFDEIEDIFNDGGFFQSSTVDGMKAEINSTLESNLVPSIWITNDVHVMDQAFLRRFDIVIKMDVPPKSQRSRILRDICGNFIDDQTIDRLAECEHLSPAMVSRTKEVVSKSTKSNKQANNQNFLRLINQTLDSQGFKKISMNSECRGSRYSLQFLNTDIDLKDVMDGLKENGSGRLCFYGPSGTGKSEYAHWLSNQIDRPLLQKKGSDLLSMWVGATEKNISKAFEEAEAEDAILLLDEVDSFLQDRRHSTHSWEITQINELLTQMEEFNGLLIATTNLIDTIDRASLRRFDAKVKFDYLNPNQRYMAFDNLCSELEISSTEVIEGRFLDDLDNLTMGDFASIRRKNRFSPIRKDSDLFSALVMESELKGEVKKRRIGFH